MSLVFSNLRNLLSNSNTGIHNLAESVIEDIKVRCCFVTKKDRAEKLAMVKPDITPCPDVKYPTGKFFQILKYV